MGLPPTSTRTRELPSASGRARRRSAAASAASSASSISANEPGCFTWNTPVVSRGTDLDERVAVLVVDLAIAQSGQHARRRENEESAAGTNQPPREGQPLFRRERRPGDRHV